MSLTLKYNEESFAVTILEQALRISEDVQDSFAFSSRPRRTVWFSAVGLRRNFAGPWRVQIWRGDPTNADLLEEGIHDAWDICAAMDKLCSSVSRGTLVVDGGSTLIAENICEAVVKQNPNYITPETADAVVQMLVYGTIPHK